MPNRRYCDLKKRDITTQICLKYKLFGCNVDSKILQLMKEPIMKETGLTLTLLIL